MTLCATTKVSEGYCSVATFQTAYNQCLTDNCGAGSANYMTGAAISQATICAAASSIGVTGTITGTAAGTSTAASGSMTSSAAASTSSSAMNSTASGAAGYVAGLNSALAGAGLTTLAGAVAGIAATNASALAGVLSGNHTVFGPTNDAFTVRRAKEAS